jgi:glutathione S-transferase
MSELTLIVGDKNRSSWSMRAYLALLVTGLPHRVEVVRLDRPDTRDLLTARSPSGKVPVLLHGSTVVWDSLAIIETLAELAPAAGLWPADQAARAAARSACAEMHSGFADLRRECSMDVVGKKPVVPSEAVQRDVARLEQLFAYCRGIHGAGGPFLFGAFGAADCCFAPVVTRFVTYDLPVSPATRAYMDAVLAHGIVARWIAEASAEVAS